MASSACPMRPSSISNGSPTTDAPKASTYQAMASRALATVRYGSAAGRGGAAATAGSAAGAFGLAVGVAGPAQGAPVGSRGKGTWGPTPRRRAGPKHGPVRAAPSSQGTVNGGGASLRAASIAARKVSDVRSSAVPRSAQRRTKYPYTTGSASSYTASSARGPSLPSGSALTSLSSPPRPEL